MVVVGGRRIAVVRDGAAADGDSGVSGGNIGSNVGGDLSGAWRRAMAAWRCRRRFVERWWRRWRQLR